MNEKLSKLFIVFFKIGLFTFGGGYAMISIVKENCVDKYNWLSEQEFLNMIAVSESTPGPIAINMATYIGYKKRKMIGAISSTLGVILPSMIIIYLISLFLNDLLEYKIVRDAFLGIRIAVSVIILRVGVKLFLDEQNSTNHKALNIIIFCITFLLSALQLVSNIKIGTIYIIISIIVFSFLYSYIVTRKI